LDATRGLFEQHSRVADVAQPLARIALQAPVDERLETIGHAAVAGFPRQHEGERVADGRSLERRRAGDHFMRDNAERPDIRALVDGLPARLFRRHIRGGAQDGPRHGGAYGYRR
jgi:hypothetical protein